MALGALLLEDDLAANGVATFLEQWREAVEHLLAVGVGQPTALGEQHLGARGDVLVGVRRERLLLIEGQLGNLCLIVLEGVDQGRRSTRIGPA